MDYNGIIGQQIIPQLEAFRNLTRILYHCNADRGISYHPDGPPHSRKAAEAPPELWCPSGFLHHELDILLEFDNPVQQMANRLSWLP